MAGWIRPVAQKTSPTIAGAAAASAQFIAVDPTRKGAAPEGVDERIPPAPPKNYYRLDGTTRDL